MHEGSITHRVIWNWIKMLVRIVNIQDTVKRCPSRIDKFFEVAKIEPEVQDHIIERINRYSEVAA